jgi:hypothetical protein
MHGINRDTPTEVRANESAHTGSAVTSQTQIPDVVPDRLTSLDYEVLDEFAIFDHRGHSGSVDCLLSYLGSALENAAIKRGNTSEPGTLSEFEAVDVVLNAVEAKYPAWFGDEDAIAGLEHDVSDEHLSKSELEESYFAEEVTPDTVAIPGDDWTTQKRVIIPLATLILTRVQKQMVADRQLVKGNAKESIRRTIIRETKKHDLEGADIADAVEAALESLRNA